MTLVDFIKKARLDSVVSFGDGGPGLDLRAPGFGRTRLMADCLSRVLPETSEIHSGWRQGKLQHDWSGEATWWLVADDRLVKLTPTLRPETGDFQLVDVAIGLLPLAEAKPPVVRFTHRKPENGADLELYGAHACLVLENETIEIDSEPDEPGSDVDPAAVNAATHFICHLDAAVQRARGVGRA
jgi:hypothetical protein